MQAEAKQIINRSERVLNLVDVDGKKLNELRNGDRIVRNESTEAYQKMKEKENSLYKDNRRFIKSYHPKHRELIQMVRAGKISKQAVYLFNCLSCYIDFSGDNIVRDNGKELGTLAIADKILGESKANAINLLKELMNNNLVGQFKVRREVAYILNPLYYNRGRVSEYVLRLFKIDSGSFEEIIDADFVE